MSPVPDRKQLQDRKIKRIRGLMWLSTASIFCMLCLGLYIVYYDAGLMRSRVTDDFNRQQLMLARVAAAQIGTRLQDAQMGLKQLSTYDLNRMGSDEITKVMQHVVHAGASRGILEAGLYSDVGGLVARYAGSDLTPLPYNLLKAKHSLHSERLIFLAPMTSIDSVTTSFRIEGLLCMQLEADHEGGILYLRLDLNRLVGDLDSDMQSEWSGYTWIIDDTGRFLFHPHSKFIALNASAAHSKASPGSDFSKIDSVIVQRMLAGEAGTDIYSGLSRNDWLTPIPMLLAFAPVKSPLLPEESYWSVAVNTPESDVVKAIESTTVRHITAEAAIILGLCLLGLVVVIYERRMAKALFRRVVEQEEYLSSIMRHSVDGIILMDNDSRVLVWNHGAELIFGYTEKEMIGRTLHRIIPPEFDAERELGRMRDEVLKHGSIRNYRTQRVTADGCRIWVDISRAVVRERDGEIIGNVGITKDVTEEVAVEQHLYGTEKLASIGTLAAGVAHEINNPLGVILGFTDLLKEKFPKGSSEREDLKIIEENAENAKKTVEHLLGFARVSEGEQTSVDVNDSLTSVLNIVSTTLDNKKVQVVVEVADDLPRVAGDPREFQQVIFNLINNALAAMKENGGMLTLSAWIESRRVCVRVTDNGCGIPDRVKARVFDPFFTTKKVGEGTGLGLSLCYGMVNKSGGSIDFFSHSTEDDPDEPGGTSFTVTLRIRDAKQGQEGKTK
ncbi:MAG: PAS domain S-box protein [candidate division Zixibacteria bacterium]|nr:PAS domain S-box protein [candidate division Zixibacteria bacterium]